MICLSVFLLFAMMTFIALIPPAVCVCDGVACDSNQPLLDNFQNMTLLVTEGGVIYGFESGSSSPKWTVNTGGPLLAVERNSIPVGSGPLNYSLAPLADGTVVRIGKDGAKVSSTSAKELVRAAPFVANGVLISGDKSSKYFTINLSTGEVHESEHYVPTPIENDWLLLLARIDYYIYVSDAKSGRKEFYFVYAEVLPLGSSYEKYSLSPIDKNIIPGSSTHEATITENFDSTFAVNANEEISLSNRWNSSYLRLDSEPVYALCNMESSVKIIPHELNKTSIDNFSLVPSSYSSGTEDSSRSLDIYIPKENALWSQFIVAILGVFTFVFVWFTSGYTRPDKSLVIYDEKKLGYGSNGTIVYEGSHDGRPVAVKKMLSSHCKIVEREKRLLCKSDGHPNVVRYFLSKEENDFHMLVLELCEMSLWDFVEKTKNSSPSSTSYADSKHAGRVNISDSIKIKLSEIVQGLKHLHSHGIVHRDVKPHNILLCKEGGSGKVSSLHHFSCKISDMGLSKHIRDGFDQSSSVSSCQHKGTVGWQPCEILRLRQSASSRRCEDPSMYYKVDIFGLGCVFYYVLSGGQHAFGDDEFSRPRNIMDGNFDISILRKYPDAFDLISRMIDKNPSSRPTAAEVLNHPFFWEAKERFEFLKALSNHIQHSTGSKYKNILEESKSEVFIKDWNEYLPFELKTFLLSLKSTSTAECTSSVAGCLRMLRNKKEHLNEYPENIQKYFFPDSNFNKYFLYDFWPNLLMYCVTKICMLNSTEESSSSGKRKDDLLEQYCGPLRNYFKALSSHRANAVDYSCYSPGRVSTISIDRIDSAVAWRGSELCSSHRGRGWYSQLLRTDKATLAAGARCRIRPPLEVEQRSRASHSKKLKSNQYYRSSLCRNERCERSEKNRCGFAHSPVELKRTDVKKEVFVKVTKKKK